MQIGFFLIGKKGYSVLKSFVKEFGTAPIGFVVSAQDIGVDEDWFEEIAKVCSESKIRFYSREQVEGKDSQRADWRFAVGWKWLIKSPNLVVCHDSLLPRYRGFAPLVNMLINGEPEIGVTAILASSEYDRGDVVYQSSKNVSYPKKISAAIDEIIPLYSEAVERITRELLSGRELKAVRQEEKSASFSLWRDDDDYFIDWNSDARSVQRFVDAVGKPYRGAAAYLSGQVVRIHDVEPVPDVSVESRQLHIGKVIFMDKCRPVVVCGTGLLKIQKLTSEENGCLVGRIPFRSRFRGRK